MACWDRKRDYEVRNLSSHIVMFLVSLLLLVQVKGPLLVWMSTSLLLVIQSWKESLSPSRFLQCPFFPGGLWSCWSHPLRPSVGRSRSSQGNSGLPKTLSWERGDEGHRNSRWIPGVEILTLWQFESNKGINLNGMTHINISRVIKVMFGIYIWKICDIATYWQ